MSFNSALMYTRSGRRAGRVLNRAHLDKCNKKQLLDIAKEFRLLVISGQRQQILTSVVEQLGKRGILGSQPESMSSGAGGPGGSGGLGTDVPSAAAAGGTPGGSGTSLGGAAGSTAQTASQDASQDSASGGGADDPNLTLRLREMEFNLKHEERLTCELELRKEEVKLQQQEKELELIHLKMRLPVTPPQVATPLEAPEGRTTTPARAVFDVGKHIALVPPFREGEVDSYFQAFERIANTLKWPEDMWALLLQCKLSGKAQEVCASLTLDQSLEYETVKKSILRAYQLVPEAYRQQFRSTEKPADQSYVEFAQLKSVLFNKWCTASKVADFEQLRELILLEEFKNCIPERIVMYLNEQKVDSVSQAAICAEEFVLTHRSFFVPSRCESGSNGRSEREISPNSPPRLSNVSSESRECFYCREKGHVISRCPVLLAKNDV